MTDADVPTTIYYEKVWSPHQTFLLAGDDDVLVAALLPGTWKEEGLPAAWIHKPGSMAAAAAQLSEYFAGTRQEFTLTCVPAGTEFQRSVWEALETIPYGTTTTYGAIAAQVGNPKASRAVGLANNRNPIALFIPCHRVVGANGDLTGYGGGLPLKRALLDHEREVSTRTPR
jgi:methylated-DNA-[protein]-cysteine S-methyltransferase